MRIPRKAITEMADVAGRIGTTPMHADNLSDDDIRRILTQTRAVAVVGASPKHWRPSNRVTAALVAAGYKVYPINPGHAGKELHGRRTFASLNEVDENIDMVDVFRQPQKVTEVVEDAIANQQRLGIQGIWLQLGVINEQAAEKARQTGMWVVMNRCPKIEFARLGIAGPAN